MQGLVESGSRLFAWRLASLEPVGPGRAAIARPTASLEGPVQIRRVQRFGSGFGSLDAALAKGPLAKT